MRRTCIAAVLIVLASGCGDKDGGSRVFFGKSMTQLTTTGGESPSWSPDGQNIVYVSSNNLWLIQPEGGSPSKLTSMTGSESNPVWHPDPSRREIAFVNYDQQSYTIYTLDLNADEPVVVFSSSKSLVFPSFTNDGSQIAFVVSIKGQGIHLVPVSGSDESTQIANEDKWDNVGAARSSPTQALIAYVENRAGDYNIYTLDLGGGKPNQITHYATTGGDVHKIYYVDWSRDGKELAFAHSSNPYFFTSALYLLTPGTGTPEAITQDPLVGSIDFRNPSFSPDGGKIVCQYNEELWILEL